MLCSCSYCAIMKHRNILLALLVCEQKAAQCSDLRYPQPTRPAADKAQGSRRRYREFLFVLAQGSFIENDFHQMRSHIVKLCLKIFIVTCEFRPEWRQVYRTFYLVQ
jgi:hypothetical protein